jgi:glycosyltransferase involved in cell wall biosynthesis
MGTPSAAPAIRPGPRGVLRDWSVGGVNFPDRTDKRLAEAAEAPRTHPTLPKPLAAIMPPWTGPRPAVSVIILTLDEEINIAASLDSCTWSDDVHVLDSGSRDRTVEIARERGAAVHVHRFESFGAQRNWAIDHIPLRHEWVFHLDADERFTPELVREMTETLARGPAEAGYYVANQMILNGSWIKHASGYPAYQMRLFHRARMRFTDHGHGQREHMLVPGAAIGMLRQPYLHLNFSKGMEDWQRRHEGYARKEAEQILAATRTPFRARDLSRDAISRRRALKRLAGRVPFRGGLRFLHCIILQRAFLDGRAGVAYARLLARYERMIAANVRSLRRPS